MGGFNVNELANIINNILPLLIAASAPIMIWMFYKGLQSFEYASQASGGMGAVGRSFATEGFAYIAGSMVVGNFLWWLWAMSSDILAVNSYGWEPLDTSGGSLEFAGKMIISLFNIAAGWLVLSAGMKMPGIARGEHTLKGIAFQMIVAMAFAQIEWVNTQFANLTPFNPLGLFMPGTPIISIN